MSTSGELVATGLLMGLVYVLTGPDHLAGMAAIVVGAPSKQTADDDLQMNNNSAFGLGLRWGLGHSLALVLGSALVAVAGEFSSDYVVMDERLGLFQGLVGIYTMVLGARCVRRSFDHRSDSCGLPIDEDDETAQPNDASSAEGNEGVGIVVEIQMPSHSGRPEREDVLLSSMRDALVHDSLHGSSSHADLSMVTVTDDIEQRIFNAADSLRRNAGGESMTSLTQFEEGKSAHSLNSSASTKFHGNGSIRVQSNRKKGKPKKASSFVLNNSGKNSVLAPVGKGRRCADSSRDRCSTCGTSDALLAVIAGLLHGASGAGSVLGVVPASEIFDPAKAAAYLGAFCVTSSLAMGGFAHFFSGFANWLAGRPDTRRYGSRVFLVEAGTGLFSLIVGAIWLIMISAGRIEDIQ